MTTTRDGAAEATDRLTMALLTIAARGERAHCSDWATHHCWISEVEAERALAVRACAGCPVWVECGESAQANDERWGVWAGRESERTSRQEATTRHRSSLKGCLDSLAG
jgi:Transcription factor WhiB